MRSALSKLPLVFVDAFDLAIKDGVRIHDSARRGLEPVGKAGLGVALGLAEVITKAPVVGQRLELAQLGQVGDPAVADGFGDRTGQRGLASSSQRRGVTPLVRRAVVTAQTDHRGDGDVRRQRGRRGQVCAGLSSPPRRRRAGRRRTRGRRRAPSRAPVRHRAAGRRTGPAAGSSRLRTPSPGSPGDRAEHAPGGSSCRCGTCRRGSARARERRPDVTCGGTHRGRFAVRVAVARFATRSTSRRRNRYGATRIRAHGSRRVSRTGVPSASPSARSSAGRVAPARHATRTSPAAARAARPTTAQPAGPLTSWSASARAVAPASRKRPTNGSSLTRKASQKLARNGLERRGLGGRSATAVHVASSPVEIR